MKEYNRSDFIEDWTEHGGVNLRQLFEAKIGDSPIICPYSNRIIPSFHGMQLDHIVPLGFYFDRLCVSNKTFAQDPCNLILVCSEENESKGEQGIYDWIPSHSGFHKHYAVLWRFITKKWGVPLYKDEMDVINDLIHG